MRVRLYLVGSFALLGLFGCSHNGGFEAREPWRRDAEVACFKSGAVKEGPGIAQLKAISGPGMCGADFPLQVSALGGNTALGFADDPRPPAGVPQYSTPPVQRTPMAPPAGPYGQAPAPPYGVRPGQAAEAPAGPMSIHPPELESPGHDQDDAGEPNDARPNPPADPLPRLGPARMPNVASRAAAVTPAATLACPMVSAVDRWIANSVQPAAQRWFGQPVVQIHQISAYSCRGMNGSYRARISEHAFGNALDVESFTLADGRKVTVQHGWRGVAEERGFLHDIHAAACQQFTTVLGPGSNIYHYNHLHLDLMRRSRTVCNPAAIPGDAVAARPGSPFVTGSLDGARSAHGPALGFAPERKDASGGIFPAAVAGED